MNPARCLQRSVPLLLALALAACSASVHFGDDDELTSSEDPATALDRAIVGQAAQYPADTTMRAKLPLLSTSMRERRNAAWAVVGRVLAPVATTLPGTSLPRFQTWYAKEEILPMFDHLFRALPALGRAQPAVFPWNAAVPMTLDSFSDERLRARIAELSDSRGKNSLGKDARVLMSPAYVGHLLGQYRNTMPCVDAVPAANAAVPRTDNFAPCFDAEFPSDAVAVKTRWMPREAPVPAYDLSSTGVRNATQTGEWRSTRTADPSDDEAYTMRVSADSSMRLMGLHIMSKELRDWMWITLSWSDRPDDVLDSDRPAEIRAIAMGAFAHYTMCVTVAFEEQDLQALAETAGTCSNPYLEVGPKAAATNCIGCHQHGGTTETSVSILADEVRFPGHSRRKIRTNFPTDYAFTPSSGLELAQAFRNKSDALRAAP
jgi:hypothetical protein